MSASSSSPRYTHRLTLYGHNQAVTSLKFSPDGEKLASGCSFVVQLWTKMIVKSDCALKPLIVLSSSGMLPLGRISGLWRAIPKV
jgi:hypothetical protein